MPSYDTILKNLRSEFGSAMFAARAAYAKHPHVYLALGIGYTAAKIGTAGYVGYRVYDRHKKNKQQHNTIVGLHPGDGGYGTMIVQAQTDFGSGWDFLKSLASSKAATMLAHEDSLAMEMLSKNPRLKERIVNEKIYGFERRKGWDSELVAAKAAQANRRAATFRPMQFERLQRPTSRILYGQELASQDFSANRWNVIEGLHPGGGNGLGKATLQDMTDFGSPLDIAKAVFRAATTFGKAEENQMFISLPERKMTEEGNRAAIRKIITRESAPVHTAPGIHVDMTGFKIPEFMQKRIKDDLMRRPTVGLVTNVLGDSRFNQGHRAFAGKSYG